MNLSVPTSLRLLRFVANGTRRLGLSRSPAAAFLLVSGTFLCSYGQDAKPAAAQTVAPVKVVRIMLPYRGKPDQNHARSEVKPRAMVHANLTPVNTGSGITYTCDPNVSSPTCAYLNTTIASYYNSTFTNANANIYITYGTTGLGSSTQYYNFVTYAQYLSALNSMSNMSSIQTSALSALSSYDATPYGSGYVELTGALVTALGLRADAGFLAGIDSGFNECPLAEPGCYNAVITVTNDPGTPLYYDNQGGSEPSDAYDFYAVVQHETDEILGTASCLYSSGSGLINGCAFEAPGTPSAVDLFRYSAPGTLVLDSSLSTTPGAYFSYDGGTTNSVKGTGGTAKLYNTLDNGNDYADFLPSSPTCATNQAIQDEEACPGADGGLTVLNDGGGEIAILNAVGFAVPPLAITSASSASFNVGSAISFQVTTTGGPVPALSYSGTLPSGVSFTDNGDGTATLAGTPTVLGVFSLNITASNSTSGEVSQTFTLTISGGTATHYAVTPSVSWAAEGVSFSVTLTAENSEGTTATGYTGTVHFSSSDASATLPANATLTNGVGTFNVTLMSGGNESITATDTVSSSITGSTTILDTQGGPISLFIENIQGSPVSGGPVTVEAGLSVSVIVVALTPGGRPWTSGNQLTVIGSDPAFTGGSCYMTSGFCNIGVVFKTPGPQTIQVVETATPVVASASAGAIAVTGPPLYFGITAPSSANAGSPITFTVTAYDEGGNVVGYGGTAAFTSTDPHAILPANSTLTGGVGTFSATLVTGGNQTITATDTSNFMLSGTSGSIAVVLPNLVVNQTGDDPGNPANCATQPTAGTTTNTDTCSLRDALLYSVNLGGANISFDSTVFSSAKTIPVTVALTIPSNTTIQGPTSGTGAALTNLVTISGGGPSSNYPVFNVNASSAGSTISSLNITNGYSTSNAAGGILNGYQSGLTVIDSNIAGNSTTDGAGGIFNDYNATLTVIGSTISGNAGAGIVNESGGMLTVTSSTISGNSATGISTGGTTAAITSSTIARNTGGYDGSGINISAGTVTLANTIVAGNTATASPADVFGTYVDNGGNIIGGVNGVTSGNVDLSVLGNYGGALKTIVPMPGSPAICGGLAAQIPVGVTTDERGLPNTNIGYPGYNSGNACVDSGAVQTNYAAAFTTEPPASATAGDAMSPAPVVTLTESGLTASFAAGLLTMTDSASELVGNTTANLSAGSATFGYLVLSTPVSTDTLTANLTLNATLATPLSLTAQSSQTAAVQSAYAVLYAPTAGTRLGLSNVTFSWTAGTGVSEYSLLVGTSGPGSSNIYALSSPTATSATITTLPASTGAIYVRLMSYVGKTWHTTDYTFTEVVSPAALTSPTAGTPLGTSNVTFNWTAGVDVSRYALLVGTSGPGSSNMFNFNSATATTATVSTLQDYTGTIYVRLMSYIGNAWHTTDYTFTEGLAAAALTAPIAGTPLGTSNVTFNWTTGVGVSTYTLMVGTSGPGSSNMFNFSSKTATTATVSALQDYTGTIYVRLMSYIGNAWHTTDYTYTEGLSPASLLTPTTGTPLGTSNVTFNWTAGVGVSTYTLMVGTSGPGSSNMFYQSSPTATTATVPTLRVYSGTIYVRLMSLIGNTWHTTDYTFTE